MGSGCQFEYFLNSLENPARKQRFDDFPNPSEEAPFFDEPLPTPMCTNSGHSLGPVIKKPTRMNHLPDVSHPRLMRRLAAIAYDWLLLLALFMLLGFIYIPMIGGTPQSLAARLGLQLMLLAVSWLFFCWFWTHGGQTLGMRAWRIRVVARNGGPIGWGQATRRFLAAFLSFICAGLGFGWATLDRDRRAWHDYLSRTDLILLPKPGKPTSTAGAAQQPQR